jgi:hypothetical protein
MTLISCLLGIIFHSVPSAITNGIPFDDIIAAAAFAYFGFVTLKDAFEVIIAPLEEEFPPHFHG